MRLTDPHGAQQKIKIDIDELQKKIEDQRTKITLITIKVRYFRKI